MMSEEKKKTETVSHLSSHAEIEETQVRLRGRLIKQRFCCLFSFSANVVQSALIERVHTSEVHSVVTDCIWSFFTAA